jgi:hypothetical protein
MVPYERFRPAAVPLARRSDGRSGPSEQGLGLKAEQAEPHARRSPGSTVRRAPCSAVPPDCARSPMLVDPPNRLCVGLVELRGIEPLTSAVRLQRTAAFFAVLRDFTAAKIDF